MEDLQVYNRWDEKWENASSDCEREYFDVSDTGNNQ